MSIAYYLKPLFGSLAPSHLLYRSCLLSVGIWAGALLPSAGTPSLPPFLYWRSSVTYDPPCKQKISCSGDYHGCRWSSKALTHCEKKGFSALGRNLSLSSVLLSCQGIFFQGFSPLFFLPEKSKVRHAQFLAGFPGLDWHLLYGPSLGRNSIPTGFNFWDS